MATLTFPFAQPTGRILEMKLRRDKPALSRPAQITQRKLQRIAELAELESKVVRERRELLLEIEGELAAGADVETGELTYYKELKLVGKRHSSPVRDLVFKR